VPVARLDGGPPVHSGGDIGFAGAEQLLDVVAAAVSQVVGVRWRVL
jgi:hypothetical protein